MAESLSQRQAAFTHAFARLVLYAESLGLKVKVQEWNRLESTQKEYMAAGKSKTMDSRHLDRLAVDLSDGLFDLLIDCTETILDWF